MAKRQNVLRLLLLRDKNVVCPYQTVGNKLSILSPVIQVTGFCIPKTIRYFLHDVYPHFEIVNIL